MYFQSEKSTSNGMTKTSSLPSFDDLVALLYNAEQMSFGSIFPFTATKNLKTHNSMSTNFKMCI